MGGEIVKELGKIMKEITIGEIYCFPECNTLSIKRGGVFRIRVLFVHKYPNYIDIWEVEWNDGVNIRYGERKWINRTD